MPDGGVSNGVNTSRLTFNRASYSANNSLHIKNPNTESLLFVTPTPALDVFVLAATGSSSSKVVMTVNFTDGSNQLFSNQFVGDWSNDTGYAILGLRRTNVTTTLHGIDNNASNPMFF